MGMLTQREYESIIAALTDLRGKMDKHIDESSGLQADLRVLQAEMRLIKFIAGGFGLALLALVAEAMWKIL